MQIIEKSVFGVRAAEHTLTSPDSATTVTLYPMIHVGTADFYRRVYESAGSHDVMLVEGVRSPVVRLLTSSYRWINVKKLGLVVQPRAPVEGSVKARIIHADLSKVEFEHEWSKLPLWLRFLAFVLPPLAGIHRHFFATRETIARKLELEDRLSADEILNWSPTVAAFRRCALGVRDERLVAKLGAEIDGRTEGTGLRIAVVYGAAHMRAVLAELKRRGFRTTGSIWLTVFLFE